MKKGYKGRNSEVRVMIGKEDSIVSLKFPTCESTPRGFQRTGPLS